MWEGGAGVAGEASARAEGGNSFSRVARSPLQPRRPFAPHRDDASQPRPVGAAADSHGSWPRSGLLGRGGHTSTRPSRGLHREPRWPRPVHSRTGEDGGQGQGQARAGMGTSASRGSVSPRPVCPGQTASAMPSLSLIPGAG